jgi:ABC-type transport system involved in multi-copper enzyme maturation permease subunit
VTTQRGRLGAYALWQLRDYMMGPGAGTFLVGLVILIPMFIAKRVMGPDSASPEQVARMLTQMFDQFVGLIAIAGPILGVAGMASADRHPGLSRFLFSKPIRVHEYYGLMWLVRGVSFLAITAVVSLIVNTFVVAVPIVDALAAASVAWILIAGVGLLISATVPRDVAVVFMVYMVPTILEMIVNGKNPWWWAKPLLTVMPPMHRLDELRQALLTGGSVVTSDVWHMVLYGAASLALAAYLVRRLPLVR